MSDNEYSMPMRQRRTAQALLQGERQTPRGQKTSSRARRVGRRRPWHVTRGSNGNNGRSRSTHGQLCHAVTPTDARHVGHTASWPDTKRVRREAGCMRSGSRAMRRAIRQSYGASIAAQHEAERSIQHCDPTFCASSDHGKHSALFRTTRSSNVPLPSPLQHRYVEDLAGCGANTAPKAGRER